MRVVVAVGVVLAALLAGLGGAQSYERVAFHLGVRPDDTHWVDVDGTGGAELLTRSGTTLTLYDVFGGDAPRVIGRIGRPRAFLYDWGDVDRDGRVDLVVVDREGVWVHRFADGKLVPAERPTIRARRGFDWPLVRRVELLRDIDRDGAIDLVQPDGVRFRLTPGRSEGGFDVARSCVLPSGIRVEMQLGGAALDRELKTSFRIPDLIVRDVDADGRGDLIAQLGARIDVHRGHADRFGFADAPTWTLDLGRFSARDRDRKRGDDTKRLRISMGRVQVNQDDLDGDGHGDFLVASGQKVWLYFAGKGFRGFRRPDRILRVSDDIAGVFPADVDGDGRTDLVLVKFAMPSMTRLVAAMIVGIDLEIEALAFRNHGDRTISRRPDRTNRIEFAVPPILSILGDLGRFESKMERAREAAKRLRVGDIDGDGILDVALRAADADRVDLYACTGRGAVAGAPGSREVMDRLIRDVLFDAKRPEWTIDRLVEYVGDLRFSLNREQIAGREPSASLPVGDGDFALTDVNGDGRADLVTWVDSPDGRRYVVHRTRGSR